MIETCIQWLSCICLDFSVVLHCSDLGWCSVLLSAYCWWANCKHWWHVQWVLWIEKIISILELTLEEHPTNSDKHISNLDVFQPRKLSQLLKSGASLDNIHEKLIVSKQLLNPRWRLSRFSGYWHLKVKSLTSWSVTISVLGLAR